MSRNLLLLAAAAESKRRRFPSGSNGRLTLRTHTESSSCYFTLLASKVNDPRTTLESGRERERVAIDKSSSTFFTWIPFISIEVLYTQRNATEESLCIIITTTIARCDALHYRCRYNTSAGCRRRALQHTQHTLI